MAGDGSTIRSRIRHLLRSPSSRLKKSRATRGPSGQVTLERVLGITSCGNSGLACDPQSGLVAYPAGCVVVLLSPRKNRQQHIINTSRKTVTTLAFSSDGKYLVTGECGHLPAVRVWDVAERSQVAELQEHKYGISCVAFSPNSKYIVSVGYQHDMSVNVWAWKRNTVVAANKVSNKVTAVSFSEDSSYFVTAGNRHVRFWYLEASSHAKVDGPVPLLGRSGLLGELRNNFFCDVACGQGEKAESTFCVTSSGLLCEFNGKRMLDKWVDLRTPAAKSLWVTEELIFCACADGMVRVFSPVDLHYVCTLPRPHHLGTDVSTITQASHLFSSKADVHYPDSVAVTYDPGNCWLSCVYNDHSLYVWDVHDLHRVGKVHSALYHASCVWDLQVYPEVTEMLDSSCSSMFLTCSADNTVRLWSSSGHHDFSNGNVLSNDLTKIIYMDDNTVPLLDAEGSTPAGTDKADGQSADSKSGVRTICVSPDGTHLASGDRLGTLRVHDLRSMEEILKVEAHDSEILCLEYSKPETGLQLLATSSRDRLIHVLDVEEDYALLQTLDEHSSSITAVRFAAIDGKVKMISCGADKSIYFRTAHRTLRRTEFSRTHHIVRKTTLYDMDVDPTCKYAVVGCQDRNVRIFNISSGKQKRSYKGSQGEDGCLLKVQTDPSGLYVATSCSDKNISLFDFHSGECVATMFGHSEIVTGIKFTNDCKYLISVSGDSCIFVWRLAAELTRNMRERLFKLKQAQHVQGCKDLRQELHCAPSSFTHVSSESEKDYDDDVDATNVCRTEDKQPATDCDQHTSSQSSTGEDIGVSDDSTEWDAVKVQAEETSLLEPPARPRRRWSHRIGSLELVVKSMLDLRQLDACKSSSPARRSATLVTALERGSTSSLQDTKELENRVKKHRSRPRSAWLAPAVTPEPDGVVLYPQHCPGGTHSQDPDYQVRAHQAGMGEQRKKSQSPDSTGSMGYCSGVSSPDQGQAESESAEGLSTDADNSDMEEDAEDEEAKEKMQMGEAFLKKHFETLSDSCIIGNLSRTPDKSVSRSTISARFLAQEHRMRNHSPFSKVGRQREESPSVAVKPLVSTVRPLIGECQRRGSEERLNTQPPERGSAVRSTPVRKRLPGAGSARVASPSARVPPVLQKSLSSQIFDADTRRPNTPSRLRRDPSLPLSQNLNQDRGDWNRPSPTTTCAPSLQPWESPSATRSLKTRSYMSPTTSSMAKMSHSSSLGDDLHLGFPDTGRTPASPIPLSSSPPTSSAFPRFSAPISPPSKTTLRPCFSLEGTASCSDWHERQTFSGSHRIAPRRELFGSPTEDLTHTDLPGICNDDVMMTLPGPPSERMDTEKFPSSPERSSVPMVAVQAFSVVSENPSPASEPPITMETCREMAKELHSTVQKTMQLYRMVNNGSAERQEMMRVLSDAMALARSEMDSLPTTSPKIVDGEGGPLTMALLEQYSQMLLKSVEQRLDHKV
ncbi:mitogen-activated protein kinase-binding protein 1-like isoform X2 [Denticeps clupeoides]|uniref:mitogen-activated protein kinase-binding protein 1-like isoform X2 n=1 Tax=Denticeps clupeoides TaxID=299321 RepID=UPI0010A3D001|nr:mitogen-activated protein kinase-binding protein 1-like isoform X2 [Denticeps clupeoides]